MITNGSEFFYSVPGLLVPKNEVQDLLLEDIEFFVDWVQNNIEKLIYLVENHMQAFIAEISMLNEILHCIYAQWLENDTSKMLKLADAGRRDMCRSLIQGFTVSAQTLAIDIQMAQKCDVPVVNKTNHVEVERYKDIISGMELVSELVEQSDFEKAFDIAACINELQESKLAVDFMTAIAKKRKEETLGLITEIIELYNNKIEDINDFAAESSELKRVLIVDDMPEVITVLSMMLKDHYKVYAFTDGVQALEFIDNKKTPDAFLLDIDMPIMDGFTLAKSIREREKYIDTPIIFLTGDSARNTVIKSLLYGAKAFIVKPASKDLIISKLSNCF